jgi:fibro-slime domain-containing protein
MNFTFRMSLTACTAIVALNSGVARGDDILVPAVIRDFTPAHPDFESFSGSGADLGIVQRELGPDHKPVYAADGHTVTSRESFDQWYRDIPGVNESTTIRLPLTDNGDGTYGFYSSSFFPIDDQLMGNEGRRHNYHFTTEVHLRFTYVGGETFHFEGDDDLWVFINGRLALDIGGLHPVVAGSVGLDAQAADLGLEPGREYPLELFHAERHTTESNFRLTTTIRFVVPEENGTGGPTEIEEDEQESGAVDPCAAGADVGDDGASCGSLDEDDRNGDNIPDDHQDLPGDGLLDFPDENADGIPDGCSFDPEAGVTCPPGVLPDADGDAVPDVFDEDRDGDGITNVEDEDQDGDGILDVDDDDIDGDAVPNELDQDIDGDGVRNNDDETAQGSFATPEATQRGTGGSFPWGDSPPVCGAGAQVVLPGFLGALLLLRRRRRRVC